MEFFTAVGEHAAGVIATAQLSERLARAREFEAFHHLTAFVIHDLKNSISALSLLSQNALANFDDPEFQRDAVKTLSRTVDRMRGLLGRLAPAREEAAFRFQPVDLASLALEATRPLDGSGRVTVTKELAPVTPAPGDPEALLRVIQNLVTNAVEAIPEQGTVTVKTYEVPGWAVCAVADTGRGMSRDFVHRSLWAPFRSTKRGGWGVGLYQAKGIVEAHGGTIEVTSAEGRGSVFTIRLPLTRAAERDSTR
jgi:putative PEP-CTERM system histidine kinase